MRMLASLQHELASARARPRRARKANEHIVAKAEEYHVEARVPMLCECDDEGCDSLFLVSAAAYRAIRRDDLGFVTAPGHALDGAFPVRREPDYWIQR